jgi:hypothetical protein
VAKTITSLIMCGGACTMLWPASREGPPKHFLPLFGPHSTFQDTIRRVSDPSLFGDGAHQECSGHASVVRLVRCRFVAGRMGTLRPRYAEQFRTGHVVFVDSRGSYVMSDKQFWRCSGDLVVVTSDDAVLVAKREGGDSLRRLVQKLRTQLPR